MRQEIKHERQRLVDIVPLPAPFSIIIDPCGLCNFKCRFCPCNTSPYKANERQRMMAPETFEKFTDSMKEFAEVGGVKVVCLYGFGEPLLNPLLPDYAKTLKRYNLCREVRITTNGSLLSPDTNKRLIDSGVDLIRISLNALSSDGYMEMCSVSLDFGEIVSNIEDLFIRSRGTNTFVSIKLIASAIKNEADIVLFEKKFTHISDYLFVEAEENHWAGFGKNAENPSFITNAVTRTFENISLAKTHICSFPLTDLTIFANGDVGVCCSDWRLDTVVGNINLQSLEEIWNGEKLKSFRIKHLAGLRSTLPSCRECLWHSPDDISNDAETILDRLQRRQG